MFGIQRSISVAAVIVCLGLQSSAQATSASNALPVRVLLIGNSQISYYYDQGKMLEKLAKCTSPAIELKAVEAIKLSASLKMIWEDLVGNGIIPKGPFDFVVIQDTLGLGIYHKNIAEEFRDYASRIDKWAIEQGGKTILWMEQTRIPPSPSELSLAERERINSDLARKLHADVAPIGLAWQRAWEKRPELKLYARDGAHPNAAGTYLTACVLYATILKKSPVGLQPQGMHSYDGWDPLSLQEIAWRTCLAYESAHVGLGE